MKRKHLAREGTNAERSTDLKAAAIRTGGTHGGLKPSQFSGDSPLSKPLRLNRTPDADSAATVASFNAKLTAALGCRTSEAACALLDQVITLQHPTATMDSDSINKLMIDSMAMLAEMQPTTATEAMLAVQMIGTHRAALKFLANATKPEDSFDGRDRNVLRASRLMQLFTEQIEAMAKLKGKSGQQRVVVEHVTVAAGGQAIVGALTTGGRGPGGENRG